MKDYLIVAYAYLVKAGKYSLDGKNNQNNLPVVPTDYQVAVAQYLVAGQ